MKENEQLYDTWERFKELLRQCPQRGFSDWEQVRIFYGGVTPTWKALLDAAAGSTLMGKSPEEATEIIETMALNRLTWANDRTRHSYERVQAIEDKSNEMSQKFDEINKQLSELKLFQEKEVSNKPKSKAKAKVCNHYSGDHLTEA